MSEPTQEYGWVTGVKDYKEGDQHWHAGKWSDCDAPEGVVCSFVRRRKIDPGEGWEIVPEGGSIEQDDEFFSEQSESWIPTDYTGFKPGEWRTYRRRLAAPPWVKFSERLPEPNRPLWVIGSGPVYCWEAGTNNPETHAHSSFLWQYATLPAAPVPAPEPPPAPKRTPEAEAFELWAEQTKNDPTRSFQTAFIAGAHWARREGV